MSKEKHPLCIRWNHWLNFPILMVMLCSGAMIYWANPVYFLPDSWIEKIGFGFRLGEGIAWHFVFAWLFAANGFIYVCYLIATKDYRYLLPTFEDLKNAPLVMLHDLGLRKELPPQLKYNAAQKIAYSTILLAGFASLLTGLAIYKPVQFSFLLEAVGGYKAARLEHFLLTLLFVVFFLVHVAQVVKAGWPNFRSMISGVEFSRGKHKTRKSFCLWLAGILLVFTSLWLISSAEEERGVSWILRRGLTLQGAFWKKVFRDSSRAPRVAADKAQRANGDVGILEKIDVKTWRLSYSNESEKYAKEISLDEIKKLPATTTSFEFKCIEGWSQLIECTGVRMSDFMKATQSGFKADGTPYAYAAMSSVDGDYYVSLDSKTLLHPQTVLCYEAQSVPLSIQHGFPLRLATPLKYGVKQIKQLGSIEFTDTLPSDYWAERGYDDYLGL